MITKRFRPDPVGNARIGICMRCAHRRQVFEIDGTPHAICKACICDVVDDAVEYVDARDQLYEGSSWNEWLVAHSKHVAPNVGCPMCGAGPVS